MHVSIVKHNVTTVSLPDAMQSELIHIIVIIFCTLGSKDPKG